MAKKDKKEAKNTSSQHVKYFTDQFDDEEVLFVFRKHPIVMRKALVWGMLAWLIGPIVTSVLTYVRPENPPDMKFFGISLLLSMLLGILILIPSWIGWYFSIFITTDQRFIQITQKGLFHRAVADLALAQIQSVNYEVSGLQETLLGFGTIKMQTYVGDLTIHDVHHPAKIQKKIVGILREKGIVLNKFPTNDNQSVNPLNEETEDQETEAEET